MATWKKIGQMARIYTPVSGVHTGVQTRIKEINPLANFVPCSNHSLNLSGVHASQANAEAITFFGTVDRLYNFFSSSTGRWQKLQAHLKITLHKQCDTRWSSKAAAVRPIFKQFNQLVECLEELRDEGETNTTRADAGALLENILRVQFLAFLNFWGTVLPTIDRAQKIIQDKHISFVDVLTIIKSVSDELTSERDVIVPNSVQSAIATCEDMGINVQGLIRRRTTDAGLDIKTDLCRLLYEAIDKLRQEIERRYVQINTLYTDFGFICNMEMLLSDVENKEVLQKGIDDLHLKYPNHFNADDLLEEMALLRKRLLNEVSMNFQHEKRRKELQKFSVLDLLNWVIKTGAKEAFGNIVVVLQLVLTIAVSVASCERSFSKLKLLKTYLRSTMSQARLRGLAIISIEKAVASSIDFDDVIKDFAKIKARLAPL